MGTPTGKKQLVVGRGQLAEMVIGDRADTRDCSSPQGDMTGRIGNAVLYLNLVKGRGISLCDACIYHTAM